MYRIIFFMLIFFTGLSFFTQTGHTEEFKICIMQDKWGEAAKYKPLAQYLKTISIDVVFVPAKDYREAAKMFSSGELDGMFSGSGVAGCMIIKNVAKPLVRPVSAEGWSTYWAVILARKGSAQFSGTKDYFKGKRVVFTSLASSGEFYFRSIQGAASAALSWQSASSHAEAIQKLSMGIADIAIVKNRVYDSLKSRYPDIVQVGRDNGENPDSALIVSNHADEGSVQTIAKALLELGSKNTPSAITVREQMKIAGFIPTTREDFASTLSLLKQAGVDADFDFSFGPSAP